MPSPEQVFRNDPRRQSTLKALWPDLFESLDALVNPKDPSARVMVCASGGCPSLAPSFVGPRSRAVARGTKDGHPMCAGCLNRTESMPGHRPGGWPLAPGPPERGPHPGDWATR